MISTSTDPVRPEQAIDWFRNRVPIDAEQWYRLDDGARRRAFTVSGVSALDMLSEVWRAIDSALANGTHLSQFKEQMESTLRDRWGSQTANRVQTIFRTNVQSAYSAGRYQQMTDPDVVAVRPFWEFVAVLDAHTTQICLPLEGTVKRYDDPWWSSHYPPLHFQCRSTVSTMSIRQARRATADRERAASTDQPYLSEEPEKPLEGFGGHPNLSEWRPQATDYPPELWSAYVVWDGHRENHPGPRR